MREDDVVKNQVLWAVHNIVAHPLMEVCWWVGYVFPKARDIGKWVHDATAPSIF